MTDTEILDGMQALLDEHFRSDGISIDFCIGQMGFVIPRPSPVCVPNSPFIQRGPAPNLRALLQANMSPHIVRLVTNKLTHA